MNIFISPPFGNYAPFFSKKIRNEYGNTNDMDTANFIPIKGSFTLESRDGLLLQIIKTLRYSFTTGGWINKIGLRNKGIDYAVEKYKKGDYTNSIISVAVMNPDEIPDLLKKIPIDMPLEINVSCPNVGNHISDSGVNAFINRYRRWCIIKLSPVTELNQVDGYYKMGFRQFHCSNTLPVQNGGASGEIIKPYTEKLTKYIRENYKDATIISGGGIKTVDDIKFYKKCGATYYSISTLCFSPIGYVF